MNHIVGNSHAKEAREAKVIAKVLLKVQCEQFGLNYDFKLVKAEYRAHKYIKKDALSTITHFGFRIHKTALVYRGKYTEKAS